MHVAAPRTTPAPSTAAAALRSTGRLNDRGGGRAADHGFEFRAMGTSCRLRLCARTPHEAWQAAERAVAEVRRLETKYSRYRADSVVSRINAAAGTGEPVEVDAETAALLDFAAQLHAHSEGLFDITSGVLRRAWDFGSGRLPSEEAVRALLPLVGWQQVGWDGQAVSLAQAGMELDFGGFAKEYAADSAASVLIASGIGAGTVNLGGDVRILGPHPDGRPWSLGVADPRRPADRVIAGIELSDGALATSGDYERFMDVGGRRYCHILDPRTGWPVAHWQSVSVVGPSCLAAGALTTIGMLKREHAHAFLREQGVGFLTVDREGAVHEASV
jgi:FAD:protein FMN transferase